jgi:transposase
MMDMLGIDIAKAKFDVALLREGQSKLKFKTFDNQPAGFERLRQWLQDLGVVQVHACLEATGPYGEALAEWLFDAGHVVSVINPAQARDFAKSLLTRNKTDTVDAAVLARFGAALTPPPWSPPPPAVRLLRALLRRLAALEEARQQEHNRLLVADVLIVDSIQRHLAYLDQEIAELRRRIQDHIDQDPDLKQKQDLLQTIPGIGTVVSQNLLSFINRIEAFESARQLAAFAGLTPKRHESGSSVHGKTHLSKIGHADLRKLLYFPAMSAIRHNPLLSAFAQRLRQNGKAPKLIIAAVMRKLLHIAFGVLRSSQPFNPDILNKQA